VPVAWQTAVQNYLRTGDETALANIPQGSMPVIIALMGQAARRSV
jgi:hypothetical protein